MSSPLASQQHLPDLLSSPPGLSPGDLALLQMATPLDPSPSNFEMIPPALRAKVDAPVPPPLSIPSLDTAIAVPQLDPLAFLIHTRHLKNVDSAAAVNRLLIELLSDEGLALINQTSPIHSSAEPSPAYVPRKRRKEEKCPLCLENPLTSSCGACGCAACFKKTTNAVVLTCPECREKFHVDCFPTKNCPGCAMAKMPAIHQVAPTKDIEAEVLAYVTQNLVDEALEAKFHSVLRNASPATLVRLHKALQTSRQALIDSLKKKS